MLSFKIIGILVLEKIFKGVYHIWALRPSLSRGLDQLQLSKVRKMNSVKLEEWTPKLPDATPMYLVYGES